ncbi:MAG: hypothetical protein GY839_01160 [candidate division Zixibacteria bacterium]|nr:hypothetical protein [candidate division Zixibacteria bacterium]
MNPIDKITIAVGKIDETVKFYSETFGISFNVMEIEGNKLYKGLLGDIEILLCPKAFAGIEATENTIQLRFVISDISVAIDKGVKSGGTILNDIFKSEGISYASLRDPNGNSLELIQKA